MSPALLVLIAAVAASPEAPPGDRVDALEVNGLYWTDRDVVDRELPWKTGESVTPEAWDLGLVRLRNMGLFASVEGRLEGAPGARRAVVDVEERFTLNPLFSFKTVGTDGLVRVGLSDNNLRGRFLEFGAQYERFGAFNGGQAWLKEPRLFGRRIGGMLLVERLTRPRPGYADQRSVARLEVTGEVNPRFVLGGRAEAISDAIVDIDAGDAAPIPAGSAGMLASATVKVGRVDTVRLRQEGWSLEVRPGVGLTGDPVAPTFGSVLVEALALAMAGEGWTFGLRAQAAAMTEAPVQHRYYLGGLDLVRGFVDNAVRTRGYALVNLEARVVVFESTWFALVPTAFLDAAIARGEDGAPVRTLGSAGIGVRTLVPKMLATGLRFDLAVPFNAPGSPLLSTGVFQFF